MLTLDRPQDANLKEREVARSVRVRVRPDGPLVDLPPGKTTIGSSPRCNIRIQQPGVQPLHCLILREADGLSVRRWAGETVLNGQRLEESAIGPGDCLQVGPVELEILLPQTAMPPVPQPVISSAAPMADAPAPSFTPTPEQANSSRLRVGRDRARSRTRQMLTALRERREADRGLRQRIVDLEGHLGRAAADRKDAAGQLQIVRSELAAARQQAVEQQAFSDANRELVTQNEQLNNEVSSLTQRIEQLGSEKSSSAAAYQAIVDERESLAAEGRRLADETWHLREQLQQHANRCSELSAERDEARGQSESLKSELHSLTEREAAAAGNAVRLEYELTQLQQHAAELSNQITALYGERDDAWRQCETLRAEVHSLNEREVVLAQNVGRLEYESVQLQSHGAELSSQITALYGERDDAWRQCETLRAEVHSLNEREVVLAQNVGRLEYESVQLQSHGAELSSQITALYGERDDAWRQCETLRAEVHSLNEREVVLAQNVGRLEHESVQLQSHGAELSSQITALCSERDDAWRQCESLRSEVYSLNDREAVLTQNVGRLDDEIAQVQTRETKLSIQIAELCGERDEAWQQCESLRAEVHALHERETELSQNVCRLEHESAQRQSQGAEFLNQIGALRGERDELRQQNEQLRSESKDLAQERAVLADEQAAGNRERDSLRQQLEAAADEEALRASARAELVAECERLKEESDRLPQLEQKVRDAVADRENTSSELYRALLQLAEMQERDDNYVALAAAHSALNTELEKSVQDIAALQTQIDSLSQDCITADASRQALDRRTAELIESHQQLAYDKTALTAELAELREQLDAARKLEAESAVRLETAETWRQRLEDAEQNQSELAETVARLRGELAGTEQAEGEAAAAIADRERQIAEYAQLLAESEEAVRLLEKKLAAGSDSEGQFEQVRDEWQREREAALRQESQLSQRIADLELQLVEAKAATIKAAEIAASQALIQPSCPTCDAKANTESSVEIATSHTDCVDVSNDSGALEAKSTDEPAWSDTTEIEQDSNRDDGSQSPGTSSVAADEAASEVKCVEPFEASAPESANGLSELSEPTILSNELLDDEVAQQPSKNQPASFIERYSNLFSEDAATSEPKPAPVVAPLRVEESNTRKPRSGGVVRPSDNSLLAGGEGEESIEDYMVKLLQRVRGESPTTAATDANKPLQSSQRTLPIAAPVGGYSPVPLTAPPSMAGGELTSPMGFDPLKRKSSMPTPQTDLEALRALANESARRAISRHALRKHRRIAITKVIVSTLAGMTSLWLMLNADNWWSLHFVTACISMLIAAYWASEAFRALLETIRAAAKDETDVEIEELSAQLRSPLPIDVE